MQRGFGFIITGMNTILMWFIAISAVLGGLDKILGNRFGLGEKFDEGFRLIGPLIAGMAGILCFTPMLAEVLQFSLAPFFRRFGLDPAILAGILPIDMGGYQLAAEMAADPKAGAFSGVFIAATFGCTLIFTIPVGFGLMKEENRPDFITGILYGLIILPLPLLMGGLFCGLGFTETLRQSLPILILALILGLGIWKNPRVMAGVFLFFAKVIQAISITGIVLGLVTYLTGQTILPNTMPLEEALHSAVLCGILLIGCMPFAELLNRILHRPLKRIGQVLGLEEKGITGMLLSIVAVTPALGLMHSMKKKDIVINAAFLVSAAAVFGPHLSVCAANQPALVTGMVVAKLFSGICSAAFSALILKKQENSADL